MRLALADLWAKTPSVSYSGTMTAAASLADVAVKAVRWGVSEMGLNLVMDGRECPGCDSPQRLCKGTQTDIQCPGNVRAEDVVRRLAQAVNAGGAFGQVSESAFFLDPTQLGDLSHSRVIDLLNATGTSLQNLGYPVDINAGIKAANQVFANA
jgi:aspartate aminotransferase-like enzyme